MKKSKEEMIEKVKKLLALAENNGANQYEAMTSALKAQAIMAEYNIDSDEIEIKEELTEDIIDNEIHTGTGKKWKYSLAYIVAKNFRCKVYTRGNGREIIFVGYETDTNVAKDVFEFLFNAGNKLANSYVYQLRKDGYETTGAFNSYVIGFVDGISKQLEKQCTALMLVVPKEVDENFTERFSGSKKISTNVKYRKNKTYFEGERKGKEMAGLKQERYLSYNY